MGQTACRYAPLRAGRPQADATLDSLFHKTESITVHEKCQYTAKPFGVHSGIPLAEAGSVKEGDDLRTGTRRIGGEGGGAGSAGDAAGERPADRRGVVGIVAHVGKRHRIAGGNEAGAAVQVGHGLRPADGHLRGEGGGASAACDPMLERPEHSLIVLAAWEHVHKGIACTARRRTAGGAPEVGHDLPP